MVGEQVKGIIRRTWTTWALVDIGTDQLARLHVREHKRETTRYGFHRVGRLHQYAYTAYAVGGELDLYVKYNESDVIQLTCNRILTAPHGVPLTKPDEAPTPGFGKQERMTYAQKKDRQKAEQETSSWDPYVPHVDEWLEDAAIPDPETDSWVAMQEQELFEEDEGVDAAAAANAASANYGDPEDFDDDFGDEDFAEDEFAEDDFAHSGVYDTKFMAGSDQDLSEGFTGTELDGWVLDEAKEEGKLEDQEIVTFYDQRGTKVPKMTEQEAEEFFEEDDEDDGYGGDDGGDEDLDAGDWGVIRPPRR